MKNCKKKLRSFDFFQSPITLLFQTKSKISTTTGLLLSFLLYSLLLFTFFRSNMILKQNPNISDTLGSDSNVNIEINKLNLGLAVSLQDQNQTYIYIDSSLFTIDVFFNTIGNNQNSSNTSLILHNCSENDFDPSIRLNHYCEKCLCLENNSEINLHLNYESLWVNNYSYITININMCINKTMCRPKEEIIEFIHGKYFSLMFLDYYFNMQDYENPAKINVQNSIDINIDKSLSQKISISLMGVEILQDQNSLFDNGLTSFQTYFQQDYSQYSSTFSLFQEDEDLNLVQVNIWPSLNKRTITRKYQKLTEVLSNIGGLANSLQFVGALFATLACYVKILRNISKKINNSAEFIVDPLKFLKSSKKFKPMKSNINNSVENIENEHKKLHINVFTFSNSIEMLSRNHNDINVEASKIDNSISVDLKNIKLDENEEHYMERSKSERKTITKEQRMKISKRYNERVKLKFSVWEYIKYYFKKMFKISLSNENKLIEETEKAYKQNYDIILILKRLLDLEKLKGLFLNDRQKILFDLRETNFYPNTQDEISEAIAYYQDENNLENFSDLDNKLIEYYYKHMK